GRGVGGQPLLRGEGLAEGGLGLVPAPPAVEQVAQVVIGLGQVLPVTPYVGEADRQLLQGGQRLAVMGLGLVLLTPVRQEDAQPGIAGGQFPPAFGKVGESGGQCPLQGQGPAVGCLGLVPAAQVCQQQGPVVPGLGQVETVVRVGGVGAGQLGQNGA